MAVKVPDYAIWERLLKEYPTLQTLMGAIAPSNPFDPTDLVGSMGMAGRVGKKAIGAMLPDNAVTFKSLQNKATKQKTGDALQEMRRKIVEGPTKVPIDKNVSQALRIEGNLGFDTVNEAAAAIIQHPDWAQRWEITNPRFKELIETWRRKSLVSDPSIKPYGE